MPYDDDMAKGMIEKLDLRLHEVLHYDILFGVAGGVGALWLSWESPATLVRAAPDVLSVVAVVIGAVIAGTAVIAAFMDAVFLRKIHLIGQRAKRYVVPFVATAAIGVGAGIFMIFFIALPPSAPHWLFRTLGGISGFFALWTISSVWPLLRFTLEFVDLKSDAADVPDDVVVSGAPISHLPSARSE